MAIIKCPECGHDVSDKAISCPHCGFGIATLKHCEECNAIISESEVSCPNCGCPTPWARQCPECRNYVLASYDNCPICGFDMVSHYGRVNTLPPVPEEGYEYDWDEDIKTSSKKKWAILGAVVIAILVSIWGISAYRGHNTKIGEIEATRNGETFYNINPEGEFTTNTITDNVQGGLYNVLLQTDTQSSEGLSLFMAFGIKPLYEKLAEGDEVEATLCIVNERWKGKVKIGKKSNDKVIIKFGNAKFVNVKNKHDIWKIKGSMAFTYYFY